MPGFTPHGLILRSRVSGVSKDDPARTGDAPPSKRFDHKRGLGRSLATKATSAVSATRPLRLSHRLAIKTMRRYKQGLLFAGEPATLRGTGGDGHRIPQRTRERLRSGGRFRAPPRPPSP
jgi:hypothetical protein